MNISLIVIFSFELIEKYYFIQKKFKIIKKYYFGQNEKLLKNNSTSYQNEQVIRRIKKEKQVKNLERGKFVGVCEKMYFLYIEDPSYSGFIYFFFS